MKKHTALRLLHRTRPFIPRAAVLDAADQLHCTPSAVYRWDDELAERHANDVLAALVRRNVREQMASGRFVPALHIDAAALMHPDDVAIADDELNAAAMLASGAVIASNPDHDHVDEIPTEAANDELAVDRNDAA
jgi:hypothetical protein